ncbi:hypothetical protein ACCQ13_06340 [Xanthomonas sp. NCPPB 1638]|uniref:hypothetical protein n=1 Tax=Xanthomonas TaxID=338 RepID=UPI0011B0EF21|nr:hypothetical protein [Xanthomonas cucurbitae]WDM76584.1 hypothetical protein K6982_06295 [Xanthomonas cucurbitae]WDM77971.1 hypothetical protein K6980_12185 [Xanthomonas cucurbitae]WDM81649.1 hypothetical protein K6979_12190 [Xanthomonas cucurbitae]
MIDFISNFFARKNAAGSIATLLEFQQAVGRFHGNPYIFAQYIVDNCWNHNKETFRQSKGIKANHLTIIAMSLAWGISKTDLKDPNIEALLTCLKTAIDEARRSRNKSIDLDINLVNMCERIRNETIQLITETQLKDSV